MDFLINMALIIMAALGALYALGLGIAFIAMGGDKDLLEEDALYCDCPSCSLEQPGKNGN